MYLHFHAIFDEIDFGPRKENTLIFVFAIPSAIWRKKNPLVINHRRIFLWTLFSAAQLYPFFSNWNFLHVSSFFSQLCSFFCVFFCLFESNISFTAKKKLLIEDIKRYDVTLKQAISIESQKCELTENLCVIEAADGDDIYVSQSHSSLIVISWAQTNLIILVFFLVFHSYVKPKLGEDEHVAQMSSLFLVKLWSSFSHCLQLKFIYSTYLYALHSRHCALHTAMMPTQCEKEMNVW